MEEEATLRMKSLKHYLVIIAISALPFLSIFASPLMLHSHDGPMHLARMPAYYKALTHGQILPRWAADLNYGYGMPLFNFYYHIPYLAAVPLMLMGVSLVWSFKLITIASFLLSGVFMFAFAQNFFKDIRKAYVATFLFQFAPFHLIDLVVRGDVGEALAYTFLPLVLLFLTRIFTQKDDRMSMLACGVSTALLILSHSAIGLMFFGTSILFILFAAPSSTKRWHGLIGLGLGLLLTAFFWIPVFAERKYTYGDFFMKDMYKSHFAPLWMFFVPNFTNTEKLQIGGIAVNFGLIPTIAFFVGLWQLIRKRTSVPRFLLFGFILTLGALCLMQPISASLWSHISILRAFQFPWRFLNVTVFALAMIGASVLIHKKTSTLLYSAILGLCVLSTIVYWYPPLGFDRVDEKYLWNYPLDTTFFGETNLVWSAGPAGSYPKAPIELIAGKGEISNVVKHDTVHTFTVVAQTDVQLLDNTQYYPGWRVYRDTIKVPIEFQDEHHRGMITFHLPPGTHHITVSFGETPIRTAADGITVITILMMVGSAVLLQRKKPRTL